MALYIPSGPHGIRARATGPTSGTRCPRLLDLETRYDQARLFLAQGGGRAEKEKGARVYFSVR